MEVSDASDEQLWQVCRKLHSDFTPYGERKWEGKSQDKLDCDTCRWFQPLLRPGQLDWGACANPQSPRAGLLTFWGQGCGQFEEEREPGTADMRRNRSEFKNGVENLLNDALFSYAKLQTAKVNGPLNLGIANRAYDPLPPKYDYWVWYWDNELDRLIDLLLAHYLEKETDFDRRKAAEEVILEIKRDTVEYWQHALESVGRALKCDVSAVRVPDAPSREDEFWARVDSVMREALEGKRQE